MQFLPFSLNCTVTEDYLGNSLSLSITFISLYTRGYPLISPGAPCTRFCILHVTQRLVPGYLIYFLEAQGLYTFTSRHRASHGYQTDKISEYSTNKFYKFYNYFQAMVSNTLNRENISNEFNPHRKFIKYTLYKQADS